MTTLIARTQLAWRGRIRLSPGAHDNAIAALSAVPKEDWSTAAASLMEDGARFRQLFEQGRVGAAGALPAGPIPNSNAATPFCTSRDAADPSADKVLSGVLGGDLRGFLPGKF